jgi:hypothetical protein
MSTGLVALSVLLAAAALAVLRPLRNWCAVGADRWIVWLLVALPIVAARCRMDSVGRGQSNGGPGHGEHAMIPLAGEILEPGARVQITGGTCAGFRGTLAGVKEGKVLVTISGEQQPPRHQGTKNRNGISQVRRWGEARLGFSFVPSW